MDYKTISTVKGIAETYEKVITNQVSKEDLCEIAILYYKGASGLPKKVKERCFVWGEHINEANSMPRDCFCELIGTPTHRVVAIMIYAFLHSERAWNFRPLHGALYYAMNGAITCGLGGHGYESEEVLINNLKIYEDAGINDFLKDYPFFNEKFTSTIVNFQKQRDEDLKWHEQEIYKYSEINRNSDWYNKG